MKPEESIPLVTIIAFGCDHYENLKQLSKVKEDLQRVKEVFCTASYSVIPEERFIEVYDKTSFELRSEIQHYLFDRSADQDILILYFCGHGTAIGRDDFGFCMNVSLVLLVDSCYSGQISKSFRVPFTEISGEMSTSLVSSSGNLFGLITSCTDVEQVNDIGMISKALKDICEQGSDENSPFIQLGFLSDTISERIDRHAKGDSKSRVFVPSGRIFSLPVAHNVQYFVPPEPVNIYSFTKPYLDLLLVLWNAGKPVALTASEILEETGSQSAYANHNKLSFLPWDLIYTNRRGRRELTQRGIEFLNGKIKIPKIIVQNKNTRECVPAKGSPSLQVVEKKDLFGFMAKIFTEVEPFYE